MNSATFHPTTFLTADAREAGRATKQSDFFEQNSGQQSEARSHSVRWIAFGTVATGIAASLLLPAHLDVCVALALPFYAMALVERILAR